MYQQTRLSDTSAIGAPGPTPYVVANWSDAELADLDAMKLDPQFGLDGTGFWPVDVTVPAFDPASQVLVQPMACDSADAAARRWKATATVRAMTAAEHAAAHPPRTASAKQVRYALNDLGERAAWEAAAAKGTQAMQDWWGWTDPIAEDATKLGRLCTAVGITPAALFDKAVTE